MVSLQIALSDPRVRILGILSGLNLYYMSTWTFPNCLNTYGSVSVVPCVIPTSTKRSLDSRAQETDKSGKCCSDKQPQTSVAKEPGQTTKHPPTGSSGNQPNQGWFQTVMLVER